MAAALSSGALGGLIGLGGAEFRLPLLIGAFQFGALEAVILNKAMSLVVVVSALPFRAKTVPLEAVGAHWPVIVNLLAGSLAGAWLGAGWAIRLKSQTLHRVIAIMLVAIAGVLLVAHQPTTAGQPLAQRALMVLGVGTGFGIGVVAALLGVAGGELLIPALASAKRRKGGPCLARVPAAVCTSSWTSTSRTGSGSAISGETNIYPEATDSSPRNSPW